MHATAHNDMYLWNQLGGDIISTMRLGSAFLGQRHINTLVPTTATHDTAIPFSQALQMRHISSNNNDLRKWCAGLKSHLMCCGYELSFVIE